MAQELGATRVAALAFSTVRVAAGGGVGIGECDGELATHVVHP